LNRFLRDDNVLLSQILMYSSHSQPLSMPCYRCDSANETAVTVPPPRSFNTALPPSAVTPSPPTRHGSTRVVVLPPPLPLLPPTGGGCNSTTVAAARPSPSGPHLSLRAVSLSPVILRQTPSVAGAVTLTTTETVRQVAHLRRVPRATGTLAAMLLGPVDVVVTCRISLPSDCIISNSGPRGEGI
jgi:hypothetical protein